MMIQKQILKTAAGLVAVAAGLAFTGTAQADHEYDILRAKANAVYFSMVEMDRTLIDYYVPSRNFGEIMATSARIKAKSLYLRGMARHGSGCQWATEIDRLDQLVHRLESQIENAHFRAERGLDPPISYCSIEVGRRLAAVRDLVHCMLDALVAPLPPPAIISPVARGHQLYHPPGISFRTGYDYARGPYPTTHAGGYGRGRGHGSVFPNEGGGITLGHRGLGIRIGF